MSSKRNANEFERKNERIQGKSGKNINGFDFHHTVA